MNITTTIDRTTVTQEVVEKEIQLPYYIRQEDGSMIRISNGQMKGWPFEVTSLECKKGFIVMITTNESLDHIAKLVTDNNESCEYDFNKECEQISLQILQLKGSES